MLQHVLLAAKVRAAVKGRATRLKARNGGQGADAAPKGSSQGPNQLGLASRGCEGSTAGRAGSCGPARARTAATSGPTASSPACHWPRPANQALPPEAPGPGPCTKSETESA